MADGAIIGRLIPSVNDAAVQGAKKTKSITII
jgi:hypothetical protein